MGDQPPTMNCDAGKESRQPVGRTREEVPRRSVAGRDGETNGRSGCGTRVERGARLARGLESKLPEGVDALGVAGRSAARASPLEACGTQEPGARGTQLSALSGIRGAHSQTAPRAGPGRTL